MPGHCNRTTTSGRTDHLMSQLHDEHNIRRCCVLCFRFRFGFFALAVADMGLCS